MVVVVKKRFLGEFAFGSQIQLVLLKLDAT